MTRQEPSLAELVAQMSRMPPQDRKFVIGQLDAVLQQRLLPYLEAHHGTGALSTGLRALLDDADALTVFPVKAAAAIRQVGQAKRQTRSISLGLAVDRPTASVANRLMSFVRAGGR